MTYKISYPHLWNREGTYYGQLVRVMLTKKEASELGIPVIRPVNGDINGEIMFTQLHQRDHLAKKIGCYSDKRFLNYNTAFKFEVS